jgi:membrane protease YdiL (CAAX protease family)
VTDAWRLSGLLADVLRFVRRPDFRAEPVVWSRTAALALLVLIALDLAQFAFASRILDALGAGSAAEILPRSKPPDGSFATEVFTGLLVAPLLEELLFRGWLTGRGAGLRFAAYGFAALALFAASAAFIFVNPRALGAAGALVVFAGLLHWLRTRTRDKAVPAWFRRHFPWLVWGSSLLFGLIHLGNHEALSHPLGIVVVLPQVIGGLLLAWTRTRLGLAAAIGHHAAFNAVWLAARAFGG